MSGAESAIDPRIQVELEKLNSATDKINSHEVELDEAKREFRKMLSESLITIKQAAHKLGNAIESAKPYYEARLYAAQVAKETEKAAIELEKSKSNLTAAKEMVNLAEHGLEQSTLDAACQEMLSHATSRVHETQIDCTNKQNNLRICLLKKDVANNRVSRLQQQLKSAIKASSLRIRRNWLFINLVAYEPQFFILPYYETRANFNGLLKDQKLKIDRLEEGIQESKVTYNEALRRLEEISEDIHRMRREQKELNNTISDELSNLQVADTEIPQDICNDEYLNLPAQLSLASSPIRQRKLDDLESPHLYYDYRQMTMIKDDSSTNIYSAEEGILSNEEIEKWTDIPLSNSESSSSGYSNKLQSDDNTLSETDISSCSSENKKVTYKVTKTENTNGANNSSKEKMSGWISLKNSGRRQSIDILLDAGDRVKDVFSRVGKSLERRNSESELPTDSNMDFLFFRSENKDALSDEQVENLLLNIAPLDQHLEMS